MLRDQGTRHSVNVRGESRVCPAYGNNDNANDIVSIKYKSSPKFSAIKIDHNIYQRSNLTYPKVTKIKQKTALIYYKRQAECHGRKPPHSPITFTAMTARIEQ